MSKRVKSKATVSDSSEDSEEEVSNTTFFFPTECMFVVFFNVVGFLVFCLLMSAVTSFLRSNLKRPRRRQTNLQSLRPAPPGTSRVILFFKYVL